MWVAHGEEGTSARRETRHEVDDNGEDLGSHQSSVGVEIRKALGMFTRIWNMLIGASASVAARENAAGG